MSGFLFRLISRYSLIFLFISRFIKKSNVDTTTVFYGATYRKFIKKQTAYAGLIAKYLERGMQKNKVDNIPLRIDNFRRSFTKKSDESIARLVNYKKADITFKVSTISYKDGKTKIGRGELRALKGRRHYNEYAQFEAREVATRAYSEANNDALRSKSEKFIWKTRNDKRVRHSHSLLNGKEFSFVNPPVNEDGKPILPGEDWGCRCKAVIV